MLREAMYAVERAGFGDSGLHREPLVEHERVVAVALLEGFQRLFALRDRVLREHGERCHAVVRPEKLDVRPKGEASAISGEAQSVDGVVVSSVYLGTATQLVVELRDGARMTVLCPNTDEAERQSLPGGGADVTLSWTPEHIHLVRESDSERATADHEALARERAEAA